MPFSTVEGEAPNFRHEIEAFRQMLRDKEPFTLSKFADGEYAILQGIELNNREFHHFPGDVIEQQLLLDSFIYNRCDAKDWRRNFYVGIGCPCCMAAHEVEWMRSTAAGGNECCQTWANIWVNSNHPYFCEEVVPLFSNYKVTLVCHEAAEALYLPFKVSDCYLVGNSALKNDKGLVTDLARKLSKTAEPTDPELYLFCAGPWGNVAAHILSATQPANTYLDVGSALNKWLFKHHKWSKSRGYLRGSKTLRKVCRW